VHRLGWLELLDQDLGDPPAVDALGGEPQALSSTTCSPCAGK
jgi:hypothetical protein